MIWAVLIGNTRSVATLMDGVKVKHRNIVLTESLKAESRVLSWMKTLNKISNSDGLIVASVVPFVDPYLKKYFFKIFGKKVFSINYNSPLGIQVKVKKPTQVGADRLANAVAANIFYGAPSIVVDFGTGTTFDVIDQKGNYVGGAILPGIGISTRALHDFTAKIPKVRFEKVPFVIGKTTEEAVRSGIYHGTIGATRELLFGIRKELGFKAKAIATGGWCSIFEDTNVFHYIDPDLTVKGLSLIWNNIQI